MQSQSFSWKQGNEKLTITKLPNKNCDEFPEYAEFKIEFENERFKGSDNFTVFKKYCEGVTQDFKDLISNFKQTVCLDDHSKRTDGYVHFEINSNELIVNGQLGKSTNCNQLMFEFVTTAPLLNSIIEILSV